MLQDAIGLFSGSESSNHIAAQVRRGLKRSWDPTYPSEKVSLGEIVQHSVQSLLENHQWCVAGEIVLVK